MAADVKKPEIPKVDTAHSKYVSEDIFADDGSDRDEMGDESDGEDELDVEDRVHGVGVGFQGWE